MAEGCLEISRRQRSSPRCHVQNDQQILKKTIDDLFFRLHNSSLLEDDMVEAAAVNADINPEAVDEWIKSKSVMEPDILPFRHLDDPETVILDVGAHLGYTAVSFRNLPMRNFIHSFEPMVIYNPMLNRIMQLDPKYSFSNIACSNISAVCDAYTLVINSHLVGGTTSIGGKTFESWFSEYLAARLGENWLPFSKIYDAKLFHVQFNAARLDDCIFNPNAQWRYADRRIDGVKIDVEGHEREAVLGCARLFREHKPLLMVEAIDIANMTETMSYFSYVPYERTDDTIRPLHGYHYNVYYVHKDMENYYRKIGLIATA